MPRDTIAALRQTHKTMLTVMPLVTAAMAVSGVVLRALETEAPAARSASTETNTAERSAPPAATHAARPRARVSFGSVLRTLLGRTLLVLLGLALVLLLVIFFVRADAVGRSIELTVLVLLVFYLAEKSSRATA